MSEYIDKNNNVFKVIQRTLNSNEDTKENVLDDLFNIFTKDARAF